MKISNNAFIKSFLKLAGLAEVSTVAVMDGDKILMGKRRDNNRWTNPGGHLDPGEDPLDGAVRELFEEAGIKGEKSKFVHLKSEKVTTPKGKKLIVHAYRLNVHGAKTSMKNDPDLEVHRWNWINTAGGLPKDILENLHSPKNVLLKALGLLGEEKTAMSPSKIREMAQSGLTQRMLNRSIKHPHAAQSGNRSQWEAVDEAADMLATAKDKKPVMEAVNRMYPKSEKVAFWQGFTKEAVSKSELKSVLKKHEERETPEQEAAESKEEQKIEREAGVEHS